MTTHIDLSEFQLEFPTPEQIGNARRALGLTQQMCADLMGYSLRGWQKKEAIGESARSTSPGEYCFLLLLADLHPKYQLAQRKTRDNVS